MMTALLFYSYAIGRFSSRKIEKATYESVPTRYVAANQHPDHDTICSFQRRFLKPLGELFTQILLVTAQMGDVSMDGSTFNANKHKARRWKSCWKSPGRPTSKTPRTGSCRKNWPAAKSGCLKFARLRR
jgi:transposase